MINAITELQKIRAMQEQKPRRWNTSKLQPYLDELVDLRNAGASYGELVIWIGTRGVSANKSTVIRFLKSTNLKTVKVESAANLDGSP